MSLDNIEYEAFFPGQGYLAIKIPTFLLTTNVCTECDSNYVIAKDFARDLGNKSKKMTYKDRKLLEESLDVQIKQIDKTREPLSQISFPCDNDLRVIDACRAHSRLRLRYIEYLLENGPELEETF